MEPTLIQIKPFTVSGIATRTRNTDEMNPLTAKIPGLWSQFFGRNLLTTIPHRTADQSVYGVYFSYESDASGPYSVIAGLATSATTTEFESIEINGGKYLVFAAKGLMPQAVIQCWMNVWSFFEQEQPYKRLYSTDFELYRGLDEVAVHIAIA